MKGELYNVPCTFSVTIQKNYSLYGIFSFNGIEEYVHLLNIGTPYFGGL
jgi:hypothetical protein